MAIGVYFYQEQDPGFVAAYRKTLLDSIFKNSAEPIVLLVEGQALLRAFKGHVKTLAKPVKVIDVFDEAFRLEPKAEIIRTYSAMSAHYWEPVFRETTLLRDRLPFHKAMSHLFSYFEHLILEEDLRAVHLGDAHAFHSLGILVFDTVAERRGLKRVHPFVAPVQGREVFYDNLRMNIPGLEQRYLEIIHHGLSPSMRQETETYIAAYRQFVEKDVQAMFARSRETLRERKSLLKKWRTWFETRNAPALRTPDLTKPYVLLLLAKGDNWLSQYAMPSFTNMAQIATELWKALPLGWSLVVKDHPLTTIHERRSIFVDLARQHDNFYYVIDQKSSPELIAQARAVAFTGSRSGIDALMAMRHVLVFGQDPLYFSFKEAPVLKAETFEALPELYRLATTTLPPRDKILAYFKAVLERSENYYREPDPLVIRMERHAPYYERLGARVAQHLCKTTSLYAPS